VVPSGPLDSSLGVDTRNLCTCQGGGYLQLVSMLAPRQKLIERHLLFKETGVGSSTKAVGLFEDSGLLGIVVLSNCIFLAWAESHRVNAVGVVEELVLLGISFNVLPAIALPPAGDELHRSVCLLIRVGAVEVVAVETVVRGIEILGRNRVAMS